MSKRNKTDALATTTTTPPAGTGLSPRKGVVTAAALAGRGFRIVVDIKLEDGEGVVGIYRGPGSPIQITDEKDGEVRDVPTFLFDSMTEDNVRYSVMGGAKLLRALTKDMEGKEVAIVRLGLIPIKGGRQQMADYSIGVKE